MMLTLERRTAAPVLITPGDPTGVENGYARKSVVRARYGTRIVLRQRYSEFYMNATSAPAGSILEGPYLRIIPLAGALRDIPDRLLTAKDYPYKYTDINRFVGEVVSGEGGAKTIPEQYGEFYYEINANGASVLMPFDGQLELVAPSSGIWCYDVLTFDDPHKNQEQQRCHRQTRNIYGNVTRLLDVPVGAYALEFSGTVGTSTVTLATEDTAKAAASGNSAFTYTPVQGQGGIVSLGNARRVNFIQAGVALPASAQVHFHIAIP